MNKTVIVIGKGRGGTSLTAGILHHLNVNMGDNLKRPDEANEKGYFENWNILQFNLSDVLEVNGFFVNKFPLPSLEDILALQEKLAPRVKELVEKEAKYPLWGWKDERNLWTSQLFLPYIQNPHFIVNYRNSSSIIESEILRSPDKDSEEVLKIVIQYNKLIEEFFKKYNYLRLNVHYEEYFKDGRKQIESICKFLDIPFKEEALKIIDPRIRHF
tara:strand:+ start:702 stop:1346 length:645 start_codon:yes stop_codon:yes gene_type:complete